MIIDQMTLSGQQAYLVDDRDTGNINLVRPSNPGINLPLVGRSPKLQEGKVLEISGIDLTIETVDGQNMLDQLRRSAQPLISVTVSKEMFPGLYKDPYRHRVHNISGYEDFKRGMLKALRVMEVEGIPTLVSTGSESCSWISGIYKMPEPMTFGAAAWDLAASKKTPSDGFAYDLVLRYWQNGQSLTAGNAQEVLLIGTAGGTGRGKPGDDRFKDNLAVDITNVTAYQIEFRADVNYDVYLHEFHTGPQDAESLGRPLLKGINLLEEVAPAHEFYSLHELMLSANDYHLFDERNSPPKRLAIGLDITATLAADEDGNEEWISLAVHQDSAAILDYVSARLDAAIYLRPPVADK